MSHKQLDRCLKKLIRDIESMFPVFSLPPQKRGDRTATAIEHQLAARRGEPK